MRGGDEGFGDFVNRLTNVEALKHEKEMGESIMGHISLLRNQRVNSDSVKETGANSSLADRITNMLIYGKEKNSETDLK